MNIVFLFNGFEAVLWTCMAVYTASRAVTVPTRRSQLLIAAFTFVAFAASEIVEMKTGAWWRPIWLMIWKGTCIGILVWIGIGHYRWHGLANSKSNTGPKKSEDVMLPPTKPS